MTETYKKDLKLAYRIYDKIYGKPKTHGEWANGFNIRGKIIEAIKLERYIQLMNERPQYDSLRRPGLWGE
jgi:hypothetical protein